jgi:hypothetical protein
MTKFTRCPNKSYFRILIRKFASDYAHCGFEYSAHSWDYPYPFADTL